MTYMLYIILWSFVVCKTTTTTIFSRLLMYICHFLLIFLKLKTGPTFLRLKEVKVRIIDFFTL